MKPNWREHCPGFAIQTLVGDPEGGPLIAMCMWMGIPYHLVRYPKQVPDGWVPCGTVPWTSAVLGETVVPDYFPEFLRPWVTRKVWREEKWPLYRVFIKPADEHKRFTGFVTRGTYSGKKRGPYWCSEILSFQSEWRCYVANGEMLGAHWYWGQHGVAEPPSLNIAWPSNWCGTADFGMLHDGKIELIETNHPFSCGWYGKGIEHYAEFITLGWKWLKEKQHLLRA